MKKIQDCFQELSDAAKAKKIAVYVISRNRACPEHLTTLQDVSARFRISQRRAKELIDSTDYMIVSGFAYKRPPRRAGFAAKFVASYYPALWERAPMGHRLVIVYNFHSAGLRG